MKIHIRKSVNLSDKFIENDEMELSYYEDVKELVLSIQLSEEEDDFVFVTVNIDDFLLVLGKEMNKVVLDE